MSLAKASYEGPSTWRNNRVNNGAILVANLSSPVTNYMRIDQVIGSAELIIVTPSRYGGLS